eukprot:TRINITY_DN48727_c0_g1_i1.p1 TRINITY_DN48727_c0_g1~~TRINITY_DN48727_c0_g1_i1.p1  ORF type:complete len:168 (-),score=55.02 TRINITY_DN48727_c0_g1_i1:65-568(-)
MDDVDFEDDEVGGGPANGLIVLGMIVAGGVFLFNSWRKRRSEMKLECMEQLQEAAREKRKKDFDEWSAKAFSYGVDFQQVDDLRVKMDISMAEAELEEAAMSGNTKRMTKACQRALEVGVDKSMIKQVNRLNDKLVMAQECELLDALAGGDVDSMTRALRAVKQSRI